MTLTPQRLAVFPYTTLFRSEALTGVPPFVASGPDELRQLQLEKPARRLTGANLPLAEVVDRCLAKKDRKSTRLNSSHLVISYAVFFLKKKINIYNFNQCI